MVVANTLPKGIAVPVAPGAPLRELEQRGRWGATGAGDAAGAGLLGRSNSAITVPAASAGDHDQADSAAGGRARWLSTRPILVGLSLCTVDLVLIVGAFLLAYWARFVVPEDMGAALGLEQYTKMALTVGAGTLGLFAAQGLYDARRPRPWWALVYLVVSCVSTALMCTVILSFLSGNWQFSRLWFAASWVLAVLGLSLWRLAAQPLAAASVAATSSATSVTSAITGGGSKRALDLLVGGVAALTLAPLLLLIALAVKADSPGPAIYRQQRVGKDGRRFLIYKFRSMRQDADQQLEQLRGLNEASGPLFKMRRDPRVTRMGRLLRRWSLDELPQLINVLRGEMSLVGPRPPIPAEVAQYEPRQLLRLGAVPGITGLWQVSGRSDVAFSDMVELDLQYIRTWSLWLDLRILLRTVPAVLSSRGAY